MADEGLRFPERCFMKKRRVLACSFLCLSSIGLVALAFSHSRPSVASRVAGILRQPPLQLSGAAAESYLAQTADGQSLMQALTAARFGLQWQEHKPGDSNTGDGYLGLSHEQELNAWF